MGRKETFNKKLDQLINVKLGNLSQVVVLTRVTTSGDYDPITDTLPTDSSTTENVTAVFGTLDKRQDTIAEIAPTDVKCLISQTTTPIKPVTRDTITRAGQIYNIKAVRDVAFGSLWALHLEGTN